MYVDTLEIAGESGITRQLLNQALRGTEFPASPSDGDRFALTATYLGNPPALYKYISSEGKWIITHPNFDMLPYDISGNVFGNMNDEDVILRHVSVRSYTIKEGFISCLATCVQAATVDTYIPIVQQSRSGIQTELGNMVFMSGQTTGVFQQTTTGDMLITAGEMLLMKAPLNVNKDLSDISFTFAGALF